MREIHLWLVWLNLRECMDSEYIFSYLGHHLTILEIPSLGFNLPKGTTRVLKNLAYQISSKSKEKVPSPFSGEISSRAFKPKKAQLVCPRISHTKCHRNPAGSSGEISQTIFFEFPSSLAKEISPLEFNPEKTQHKYPSILRKKIHWNRTSSIEDMSRTQTLKLSPRRPEYKIHSGIYTVYTYTYLWTMKILVGPRKKSWKQLIYGGKVSSSYPMPFHHSILWQF